jgi:hypothetical protein
MNRVESQHHKIKTSCVLTFEYLLLNPLNAELNPICHLLTLLGTHHILHVSRMSHLYVPIFITLTFLTYSSITMKQTPTVCIYQLCISTVSRNDVN